MKKCLLISSIIIGFSGIAQADSSVTLYGVIDTGFIYEQQKSTTSVVGFDANTNAFNYGTTTAKRTKTGLRSGTQNGSRWGLKGSEDLGNGLRAVFTLENGLDNMTGHAMQGDRLFGRTAILGLVSDSMSQLDFGRQPNIASKYLPATVDPFMGGFHQANAGAALTAANMVRYDNMVMYQTPHFSGVQFGIGYSFNANGTQQYTQSGSSNPNLRALTTGLRYADGPIGIALTYDQKKNNANQGSADVTVKQWNLGAAYNFDVVKVSAAFGQTRDGRYSASYGWNNSAIRSASDQAYYDALNPNNPNDNLEKSKMDAALAASTTLGVREFDRGFKSNAFMVGLSAPIGGGTILASWNTVDPRSNPNRISSKDWDMKAQQTYNLGYTYPLSKRTNLYVYGSYAKNQDFIKGNKTTITGVGLRHRF